MFIQELRSAFQTLGAEGYAEEVVEIGGHAVKIRTLTSHESAQVKAISMADGADTRALHFIHTSRIEAISRAIIMLNGLPIPDIIDVEGERQEKHMVLRDLVSKWGDAVLDALFRAYMDLEERMEAKLRQKVRYQPPDYQASIDWHRQQIENIERQQRERERWLALSASQPPEEAAAPEETEEPAGSAAAPETAPPGPPPRPLVPGNGRVRVDMAPPPPGGRQQPDAPGVQLDDQSFLPADPDAMRADIQREDARMRAERARRMASAAMIATELAGQPPAPPAVDGPLQRRVEGAGLSQIDDPNELRRQPIPPGGPGKLEINPQAGADARNPRFVRRSGP